MSFVGHDDNPRYIELAAVTRAHDPGRGHLAALHVLRDRADVRPDDDR